MTSKAIRLTFNKRFLICTALKQIDLFETNLHYRSTYKLLANIAIILVDISYIVEIPLEILLETNVTHDHCSFHVSLPN